MSFDSQWKRMTLREAGVALIDCDHRTPPDCGVGYPYIAIPQLKDGHIRLNGSERRVSHEDFIEWTKKLKPQADDVIVVRRCSSGDSAVVPPNFECAIGQNLVVLRADGKFVYPPFLRWLIRSDDWWEQVRKYINVGAVFDSLKCREIPSFELPIPSLHAQREIATTLKALDDRITLLRETNATLEAIAQALFKSWFVDFDPVHAKQQGRTPEGMDEATAALFPDSFEESELGLVPKRWRICCVSDVTRQIFSGGTPDTRKPEYWLGDLPWFSSGETRERVIVDTEKKINLNAVKNSSTKLALPGDILIASAGQGHTRGQTSYCSIKTYINQSVVSVRADSERCDSLWLFYNLSRRYAEMRDLSDSHSSRGSLTTKLLAEMRVVLPVLPVLKAFGAVASVLMESQADNLERIASLSGIRDTLLPRLISGQLRLPEVEAIIEESIA